MDVFSTEQRSQIMSKIKGKDTKPELLVRSIVHRMGFRFRLHRKDLPGKPDMVFPKHRKVIFVHGCFWHAHPGCSRATIPKSNTEFWLRKINGNKERDKRNISLLEELGWRPLVVWECETKDVEKLMDKLQSFLNS